MNLLYEPISYGGIYKDKKNNRPMDRKYSFQHKTYNQNTE